MRLRKTRLSRTRRSGFTLRELTLAIAIGGTVMTTAVGLVHHAFDWSSTARHRRIDDQTFFRLGRQFRSDVHLSASTEVLSDAEEGATLRLSLAEGSAVEYAVENQTVTRTESRDDVAVRRESYRFKRRRTVSFGEVDSENQIRLDVKTVTPHAEPDTPIWRSLRASIGLRLRHRDGGIKS